MADLSDILDGKPADDSPTEAAPEPTPEAVQEPEQVSEPQSETTETQDTVEQPEAVSEAEQVTTSGQETVPLATFLTQKNELAKLKKELAGQEEKPAAQPDLAKFLKERPGEIPSVLDDEAGARAAMQQDFGAELANTKFQMSYDLASQTLGRDTVDEALVSFQKAAEVNPVLQQALDREANPVRAVVDWHRNQKLLAQRDALSPVLEAGGLDAYEKALRSKWEAEVQQAAPTTTETVPPPATPQLPNNFNQGGSGAGTSHAPTQSITQILGGA